MQFQTRKMQLDSDLQEQATLKTNDEKFKQVSPNLNTNELAAPVQN